MILKSFKKFLNPNFLQRIDQEYLLNHPRLWTSKIHYLIYYSIIGYWFYQQLVYNQNFNILKQYGIIQLYWEWLKDFCFNLICFLISSCPFIILLTRIAIKINIDNYHNIKHIYLNYFV
ncbi:MAG: hypothetical protein QNJ33_06800 [Crocosphaera sp.]|nr:hypothetical protein [Crocosphaera sp.]